MGIFIISDIHGCNIAFRKALKTIRLKKTDTLILLGDLIDRGPDSKGVLDTVYLLIEHGFNIICLKGNHEQMFLDAFSDIPSKINWLRNGGDMTLSSFYTSQLEKIPQEYIELISSFKTHYLHDNFIFVHAGLNMMIEDPFADLHAILWMRDLENNINYEWLQERTIIHGHNPTSRASIERTIDEKKQVICIDNGSFLKRDGFGNICVLELNTMTYNFIQCRDESIGNY